jgi:hypothetical protein
MSAQSDAALLIESPGYARAINEVKDDLISRFLGTSSRDGDALVAIKLQFEAVEALDAQLRITAKPEKATRATKVS